LTPTADAWSGSPTFLTERFIPKWTWAELEQENDRYHRFAIYCDDGWSGTEMFVKQGFTAEHAQKFCDMLNEESQS